MDYGTCVLEKSAAGAWFLVRDGIDLRCPFITTRPFCGNDCPHFHLRVMQDGTATVCLTCSGSAVSLKATIVK